MYDLINKIAFQRQQEILDGRHACTVPPLYVVYQQTYSYASHRSDITLSTTLFDEFADIYVRLVKDCGDDGYELSNHEMFKDSDPDEEISVAYPEDPEEIIEFTPVLRMGFHDKFVTCCFTRQAAEDFIKREQHNLTAPKIWVHGIMRRNIEMVELGQLFGDKPRQKEPFPLPNITINSPGTCASCGAGDGLHKSTTNLCPLNGVEETRAGYTQKWDNSTFVNSEWSKMMNEAPIYQADALKWFNAFKDSEHHSLKLLEISFTLKSRYEKLLESLTECEQKLRSVSSGLQPDMQSVSAAGEKALKLISEYHTPVIMPEYEAVKL